MKPHPDAHGPGARADPVESFDLKRQPPLVESGRVVAACKPA